jgi:hypothetical protein
VEVLPDLADSGDEGRRSRAQSVCAFIFCDDCASQSHTRCFPNWGSLGDSLKCSSLYLERARQSRPVTCCKHGTLVSLCKVV